LRGVQGDDKARITVDNMNALANKTIKALDIRKIRKYKLHRVHYRFLPRLNNSSNQVSSPEIVDREITIVQNP